MLILDGRNTVLGYEKFKTIAGVCRQNTAHIIRDWTKTYYSNSTDDNNDKNNKNNPT